MQETTKNLGASMLVLGIGLKNLAFFPALHWCFTRQPQVNLFKEALAKGNMRYFSSRAAIGLFFVGSLTRIAGQTIIAADAEHSDKSGDNNSTGSGSSISVRSQLSFKTK